MSGKFRRMIIIMLISISMILLVSCGTMEVSTNVKGNKDGRGSRGDLIAEIKVMVPKQLTKEEKTMFEKLNEISNFNPRIDKN